MPKAPSIPHVSWRDGRPRFQPGKKLRAAGLKGTDLRWPLDAPKGWSAVDLKAGDKNEGRWFSRGEAVDWSAAFAKSIKAPRAARAAPAPAVKLFTVGDLFNEWWRSPKFQLPADPFELQRQRDVGNVYSPKTIRYYKEKARVIENHDPSLWASPVDALSQPVLVGLYEELAAARGRATARGTMTVFGVALAWGRRRGRFTFRKNAGVNPARDLGMAMVAPRVRFGSRSEISTLIAVADHLKWFDMADMIMLGLWTGQRQEDRLLLNDKGLLNGRRIFKQAKTSAIVAIREAPELAARLKRAAARRKKAEIVHPRVILDESRWAPFPDDGDRYRKRFAELRALAAAGVIDEAATAALAEQWQAEARNSEPPVVWVIKPCPSLLGVPEEGILPFHEADLRDTAVTWMALAGATIPEIVSITGHTLESATRILRHYLARHPEMADSAIAKMISWYEADGETEFGL